MGVEIKTRQEYIDSRTVLIEGVLVNRRLYEFVYHELIRTGKAKPWDDLIISLQPFGTESEASFLEWKAWTKENRRLAGCNHPTVYPEYAKEFECE